MILDIKEEKFEKIIFLDIDGVLNTIYSEIIDEESIETLNELYKTDPFQIVLVTSWKEAFTINSLQTLFKEIGLEAPIIDKTRTFIEPLKERININLSELEIDDNKLTERDIEINDWIDRFKPNHFLILDDFYYNDKNLKMHLFQTNAFKENANLKLKDLKYLQKIIKR